MKTGGQMCRIICPHNAQDQPALDSNNQQPPGCLEGKLTGVLEDAGFDTVGLHQGGRVLDAALHLAQRHSRVAQPVVVLRLVEQHPA